MGDEADYRVGDEERRDVDARLQRAQGEGRLSLPEYEERSGMAWAARTRADLDALTRDLPPETGGAPTAAVEREAPAPVSGAGPFTAAAGRRAGGVLAGAALLVAAVWGGSQLLPGGDVTVFGSRTVSVGPGTPQVGGALLFGSVEVVVPEGTRADVGGLTVFGSTECPSACAVPSAQTVDVDVVGAFGSVTVMTPAESAAAARDGDRDGDRDDD